MFVVMKWDGEVCCAGTQIDSVWSTLDKAESRALVVEGHVEEWVVNQIPTDPTD